MAGPWPRRAGLPVPRRDSPRAVKSREARARRATAFESLFAPWALALAGALVSLAFLFQPRPELKLLLFLGFIAVALASGKKFSLLATLLVSLGIVAANLLVPVGKVLVSLGGFKITEAALLDGFDKAITFEGLIYISKASIRPGLRIPGRFGSIVGQAFVYYDRIVEYRGKIKVATIFEDADALMLSVWDAEPPAAAAAAAGPARARPLGLVLAAAAVVLALAVLGLGFYLKAKA